MTVNRAQRHSNVEQFACDAGHELVTYLLEPDDPRLRDMPLLRRAASWWLAGLSQRMRCCFHCGSSLLDRRHVGLLLLSTPTVASPGSAGVIGLCRKCADLPEETLEHSAARALRVVAPGARFE
jgi:hypothetical protein